MKNFEKIMIYRRLYELSAKLIAMPGKGGERYVQTAKKLAKNRIYQIHLEKDREDGWRQKLQDVLGEHLTLENICKNLEKDIIKDWKQIRSTDMSKEENDIIYLEELLLLPVTIDLCRYIESRLGFPVQEMTENDVHILRKLSEEWMKDKLGVWDFYIPELYRKEVEDLRRPAYVRAKNLIRYESGWYWQQFSDGSGSLISPEGEGYFAYDLTTKEYQDLNHFWRDYPLSMSLEEFKNFAETLMLRHWEGRKYAHN